MRTFVAEGRELLRQTMITGWFAYNDSNTKCGNSDNLGP
jgi:hypothetical protein